jgi:hypothetical protein
VPGRQGRRRKGLAAQEGVEHGVLFERAGTEEQDVSVASPMVQLGRVCRTPRGLTNQQCRCIRCIRCTHGHDDGCHGFKFRTTGALSP